MLLNEETDDANNIFIIDSVVSIKGMAKAFAKADGVNVTFNPH